MEGRRRGGRGGDGMAWENEGRGGGGGGARLLFALLAVIGGA